MTLKKSSVLARLAAIKMMGEKENDSHLVMMAILALLLDYNNDPEIREAVDAIPF